MTNDSLFQETTFSCTATGGKPEPAISAHFGDGEEPSDEDMDLDLELDYEDSDQTATFSVIPGREDCGKFIKCSAIQTGLHGEELFGGLKTISQKVI